mgnify:CR=1 FL=1
MGIKELKYDPLERPKLAKYQITTGISQVNRCEEMNKIRKMHSIFFQDNFDIENRKEVFTVTEMVNGKLLRIQNNSFLKTKDIHKIAQKIINGNNKI